MRLTRLAPVPGLRIAGVGRAREHGGRRVDNDEVSAVVRAAGGQTASTEWLDRMGLRSRWWTAIPGGGAITGAPRTEDLLADATVRALDRAGVSPAEVDVFVAATTTPSRLTSSMATVAGGTVGIGGMAVELRAGCPSGLHGLAVAAAQMALGAEVAVVAAAETLSRVVRADGSLAYLAGDGGAAVVLLRDERAGPGVGHGLLGGVFGSDGTLAGLAGAPGELPPGRADLDADRYRLEFGEAYADAARAVWRRIGPETLAAVEGATPATSRVSTVVANQAGRPRLDDIAASIGGEPGVVDLMARTANAGSASFLAALAEAWERRADPGHGGPWLLVSVGGGLSYGGMVLQP